MEVMETVTKEISEEIVKEMICDNCKEKIDYPGACGFGAEYTLSDRHCTQCGGKTFHLCSSKCLKEFANVLEGDHV